MNRNKNHKEMNRFYFISKMIAFLFNFDINKTKCSKAHRYLEQVE